MLCGKAAVVDVRHPERVKVRRVSTIPMRSSVLECCKERGDKWATEVEKRVLACIDLVAAEAVYHDLCGHFLIESALVNKLITAVLPAELELNKSSNDIIEI